MMALAMAVDAAIGWPTAVHRRIGHPVTWIGALISGLDRRLNQDTATDLGRRAAGLMAAIIVIGVSVEAGWLVARLIPAGLGGTVLGAILAWPLLAARSLHAHVAAVAEPLAAGNLEAARAAVAQIVGRDPEALDEAGVARAATESLAENTSDGVVAPVFWGVVFGLPGLVGYKAINTLDSMIGHRTPRHAAFGWASARIDDAANLVPARLTGLLFALVSARPSAALCAMFRDARQHRSPNAGWPEAAMAGALGVRLSGPRSYGGHRSSEPWVNSGHGDPGPADLALALALYRRAMLVLAAGLLLFAAV